MQEINVKFASDEDKLVWNDYVSKNSQATCFHRYEWGSIVSNAKYAEKKFLLARLNGKVCGVLPVYMVKDRSKKQAFYSLKNGLISENKEIANSLITYLYKELNIKKTVEVNISSPYQFDISNFQSKKKTTLIMELESDVEKIWFSLRSKTRNVIRKSQKSALVLKKGHEYLNDFYRIYSDRMSRKSIPFCSYDFFDDLCKTFSKESEIYLAQKDGKSIAGILVFYSGNMAVYAYSAFLPGAEKYAPIHFLVWEFIKDCVKRKISMIDMGESTPGSGVYNFKIWMGAKPLEIYSYRSIESDLDLAYLSLIRKKIHDFFSYFLFKIESFIVSNAPIKIRKLMLVRRKMRRSLL